MKKYIRFGEIPKNEKSNIYRDDQGKIGEEIGVSCFECIQDSDGYYHVIMPANIEAGSANDLSNFVFDWIVRGNCNCYIITGDKVDIGSDKEPLLKNVKILEKLNSEIYKNLNQ